MINMQRIKWMIFDENGRFLSNNGFRGGNNCTASPRFFQTKKNAEKFMKRYNYCHYTNLTYVQVEINIKQLEGDLNE